MYGVILAGGAATRLGGRDKALVEIGGQTLLARVHATLSVQCDGVIVSANGATQRFAGLRVPVVSDPLPDQPGPLAGLLAAFDYLAVAHDGARWAVTVPVDVPFLPHDFVAKLQDARLADGASIVVARSGGRAHHVAALWSMDLRHDLRTCLTRGELRVSGFIARHAYTYATWPVHPFDPFFNINTPADLAEAEAIAARL